ncbi:hypothetical protein Pfo_019814 [Paulownia fortunei]|nr:hypothetical protein Pfo_019814 [Paulownia fortunei]
MVADQRKKRVNVASLVGCTSREQYRVKRRKLELPQHGLSMRPNISLEWDNKKKSVVSKREQIGISRRHMIPFIKPSYRNDNILADVCCVPHEIFELENLCGVLSFEVWQTHLSEKERNFLSRFLPKEAELDTIVRELLAGENFHFGNPFLEWQAGASLCFGELHPDNVLHEKQSLKACKKAYYSDLQKYHNVMIENLQMWKIKWAGCKDPEVDNMQQILRFKKRAEKSMPPLESRFCDTEEKLVATPESCSWANSEKAYTEKLHKHNIQCGDGAKYMSYIKVSKEQHERVKSSMKHAGNSIQPISLNNVLGSIDALNVQPFERFEEEERKKLHDYWLKLANKDILEGFARWRKRQLQRQQLTWSLVEEMEQKLEQEEGVEKEQSDGLLQEQIDNEEAIHEMATEIEDEKETKTDYILQKQTHDDTEKVEEDDDIPDHAFVQDHNHQQIASINNSPRVSTLLIEAPNAAFLHNQLQQQIGSLNSNPQINSMEIESHDSSASAKADEGPPIVSEYSGNQNNLHIPVSQGHPLPSASDVWSAGDVHVSIYHSTATSDGFASTQELSLGHPQFIQEERAQILDLERDRQDEDAQKDMLHRQSDDMSFFSSYSNQDRNELLQSFFKDQSSLSLHLEQKHSGLEFQPGNDLIMEAGQFPGHMGDHIHPSLPLDLRQKRLNDLYMHENFQESMYSDGGQYTMPRQEHLPVNVHDWATANTIRVSAPSQRLLNSGELSQNWYMGDNGARDGWPCFEGAVGIHSLSSGSNSDQTLFSLLSECNEGRTGSSYDSMGSTERFVQARNYSGMAGGIPSSNNVLEQSPNPLNYLSGHEAAAGLKINNLGWMGIPQHNSGIQESMGKPFLRSWNQ